jgi:hypothetical protein
MHETNYCSLWHSKRISLLFDTQPKAACNADTQRRRELFNALGHEQRMRHTI